MHIADTVHSQAVHHETAGHTLVLGDPLVIRPLRFADRMLARARGASLDASLAAGCSPESSRLLAARAQDIVALPHRTSLAGSWEHLLRVAHRAPAGRRSPVPVNVAAILAAEPAIREMMERLTAPLPVSAQGVAAATLPLTNAASPVYGRLRSDELAGLLDAAIAFLDPAQPLMGVV